MGKSNYQKRCYTYDCENHSRNKEQKPFVGANVCTCDTNTRIHCEKRDVKRK